MSAFDRWYEIYRGNDLDDDLPVFETAQTAWYEATKQAADELARLRAENAELRADAERYRWLKSNARTVDVDPNDAVRVWYGKEFELKGGWTLDAAIDAARKEEPK